MTHGLLSGKMTSLTAGVLVCLSQVCWPQIQVIESAGKNVDAASGKDTYVVFELMNPSEKKVPILQLLSETNSFSSGVGTVSMSGGGIGTVSTMGSGYGQSTRLLCEAPAKLKLSGGVYQFQVGANPLAHAYATLNATGGTQYWAVKQGHPGLAGMSKIAGPVWIGIGAICTIMSVTMNDVPAFIPIMGGTLLVGGAILIPVGINAHPRMKLIRTTLE